MISEAYRKKWEGIVIRAQRRHVDWMELLDRAELLLTEERRKEVQLDVLSAMLERYRNMQPFELIDQVYGHGHAGTPDDMFKAIDVWMSQFIQAIRQT